MDRVAALDAGDVDDNFGALAEGCMLFEGLPTTLNNLDRVSVGCVTVASELVAIGTLLASECSDTAAVDVTVGRVADPERNSFSGLAERTFAAAAAGLLLEATFGVDGVVVDVVEDVAAGNIEVAGLEAMEGVIDEEGIDTGVKV